MQRKNNITRNTFLKYAETIGVDKKAAQRMIECVTGKQQEYWTIISQAILSEKLKQKYKDLIDERIQILIG